MTEVKCIFCQKTWFSKELDFLTVCGCCVKTVIQGFESQFKRPVLRLEGKKG